MLEKLDNSARHDARCCLSIVHKDIVSRFALAMSCAALVLSVFSGVAHAQAVYKYEESGLVTYGDRAPDSKQDNGHSILNNQGVVLKQVLSREERLEQRRLARQAELDRHYDRALLATFTTEEDLIRTRDDRIGMIDGLISRLDDRIRILSERLEIVNRRIARQESSGEGRAAQDSMYAEQQSIQRNIENAWSLIDSKAAERAEFETKFEFDLIRYRELKEERR
jgi:hypothetical protein